MEYGGHTEGLLRRYLLGLLEQEEQERLERQLITDDERLEELSAEEDELIDSYVRGDLSAAERERFEQHFMAASERRQKVTFAEALHKYVTSGARPGVRFPHFWDRLIPASLHSQRPLLGVSLGVALVIAIAGASWAIVRNVWLPDQSGTSLAITLRPGLDRHSGEITRVTIAPDVSTVRLQLELSRDEYQDYEAVVETDEGREVHSSDRLKSESLANERVVILSVRARLLARGDYQIKLSGLVAGGQFEEAGKYHFRVIATPSQP